MEFDAIPIFFNQRGGAPDWFLAAVIQARLTNPRSPIFVLHDLQTPPSIGQYKDGIFFVHLEEYRVKARIFEPLFFNLSFNPGHYERYCLERWLILQEFMRRHEIDQCAHFDSDV